MLLSRASQYTLQALIFLARQPPGRRVMIKDIADTLELPVFYLAKLIQAPARAGWLDTTRGRHGGVALAADAAAIHLTDIVQLVDGHRLKRECLLGFKECDDASACVMHCDWKPIKQELADGLGQYSLAALAGNGLPDWMLTPSENPARNSFAQGLE
jgi:Rrf2 family transcriptional regulator, iron-sulfur cluster assembly transcription factor